MEIEANKIFDIYRKQYFEGGYSSVYFFDTEAKDDKSFGACFLIHKGQMLNAHSRRTSARPDDSRARQQGVARRLLAGAQRHKSQVSSLTGGSLAFFVSLLFLLLISLFLIV